MVRSDPGMRTVRAWLLLVVVSAVAFVRAATARPPEAPPPAADADLRAAFLAIAGAERDMRRDAAKDFPTDHWSQDDDFHRRELDKARDFARTRRIPLGDVLRAVDDGMRERWSSAASAMTATVPPCQPRAIY